MAPPVVTFLEPPQGAGRKFLSPPPRIVCFVADSQMTAELGNIGDIRST